MQRECRKAHEKYVSNIINPDNKHSNKKFWSYIKSKRSKNHGISSLEKNQQVVTDNLAKANILNDQFTSVFTVDNNSSNQIPALKEPPSPTIQPIHIEAQGICTLLSELDSHKACGPDGMPTRLLNELAYNVAPVLALIFNASLHQGKLPLDWKSAMVVPVFKKGSCTNPSNYRPTFLTCVCCKFWSTLSLQQYLSMQIFITSVCI